MTNKIEITYFKPSGKYYAKSELDLLESEYSEGHNLARMYLIVDRIRELSKDEKLPGINSNWLDYGFITIDVKDIGYPCLIHNFITESFVKSID